MKITIRTRTIKAQRKLEKAKHGAEKFAVEQTKTWTKQAFNYARSVMPKYTEQTYRAMDYTVQQLVNGAKGQILVRDIPRGDLNMRGKVITAADLVNIMESGKWGKFHPPWSGNPRFMTATRKYLEAISRRPNKGSLRANVT